MGDIGNWIVGAAMAVLALIGLIVSARAHDTTMYWVGLVVFAFGVLFIFHMVKRSFDQAEAKR
jgi:hypothetical protein